MQLECFDQSNDRCQQVTHKRTNAQQNSQFAKMVENAFDL